MPTKTYILKKATLRYRWVDTQRQSILVDLGQTRVAGCTRRSGKKWYTTVQEAEYNKEKSPEIFTEQKSRLAAKCAIMAEIKHRLQMDRYY